jgi:hypothetical protein
VGRARLPGCGLGHHSKSGLSGRARRWHFGSSPFANLDDVSVVVVFRCEVGGARPGREPQLALARQLLDLRSGEYVDADPESWLTWHGRGIYGPQRYVCGEHRSELKARIRAEYGALGWHPWARGPHPWAGRRGTDRARALTRMLRSTMGAPGS